jgi:hypothetical protein
MRQKAEEEGKNRNLTNSAFPQSKIVRWFLSVLKYTS